tara:strand:+ start:3221 stop:5836 length:2616 start_codon:yes stop_codon:yes gene_type:complete
MRNNIFKIFLFISFYIFTVNANSVEEFNFDITEINITENGDKFTGDQRGTISSNDGIIIDADKFEYYKKKNILKASGNVKIIDKINNYEIYTQDITYKKNNNLIVTKDGSRAIDKTGEIEIIADIFEYNLSKNIIIAKDKAELLNKTQDYQIFSDFISYSKNKGKITSQGKTSAVVYSKYFFDSSNITFLINEMELSSNDKTTIKDNLNLYNLKKFRYFLNDEELRAENLIIKSNYKKPNSDKFYLSSAIINLKSRNFIAKDTEILVHKNIFDEPDNDPRIMGVSSSKTDEITKVNKAVFTSCKKDENCPPWAIQADEIIHDKKKKQLSYKNAILRVYDIPVMYFPKFFHPDPTVKKQSGFLQPELNNSQTLGGSLSVPYYYLIADNRDFTIKPTLFDSEMNSLHGEYRQENSSSSLIADFGYVSKFKSNYSNSRKNILHFFAKSEIDLSLNNFTDSNLEIYFEKTNKDTYLKIFENQLFNNISKPKNSDLLSSGIDLKLVHKKFDLDTGFSTYEDLNKLQSDRYQFILPYFNFNSELFSNDLIMVNLYSNGSNILQNTNNLRTKVINNLNFSSNELISSRTGLKSGLNLYLKNSNTVAKEDNIYKSSPQSELMNIFEINTSYPMVKKINDKTELLTPKISLRVNPSDMKNHSDTDRSINVNNIFTIDRLGLEDSFESGKSLTLGLDYSSTKKINNNEVNAKLATVFREKKQNTIPKKTSLSETNSYLFGGINYKKEDIFNIEYNFASESGFNSFKYHDLGINFSLNNFVTEFNFIEENDLIGTAHIIENKSTFNFDENNFISFKTRKNQEINLTEYYDLVYEYKNDCLIAGLKFQKKYYEDRDLEPSENLFFSITLFPLTTLEQEIDQNL